MSLSLDQHAVPDGQHAHSCICKACKAQLPAACQVFEALRSEFNTRKRDRCVRLEALGPRNVVTGLEELDRLIKEAVVATFEARAKAYDQEVPSPVAVAHACASSHMPGQAA